MEMTKLGEERKDQQSATSTERAEEYKEKHAEMWGSCFALPPPEQVP